MVACSLNGGSHNFAQDPVKQSSLTSKFLKPAVLKQKLQVGSSNNQAYYPDVAWPN